MLRIAAPHVNNDEWLELQLSFLERHTSEPFALYSVVEDPARLPSRMHWVEQATERHRDAEATFSRLAEVVIAEAAPDDVVVFMHGDSLPFVNGWNERVRAWLTEAPLVAAIRTENAGDPQPHDCFCATTAGFWRQLGTDWYGGPRWPSTAGGTATDTGAKLWRTLSEREIEWKPLRRCNRRNPHPVFFGVYGGIVYHHGGGFRLGEPMSRADAAEFAHLPTPVRRPRLLARRAANVIRARRILRRLRRGEDVIGELL